MITAKEQFMLNIQNEVDDTSMPHVDEIVDNLRKRDYSLTRALELAKLISDHKRRQAKTRALS